MEIMDVGIRHLEVSNCMFTARVARMYRFCRVCVCVSVRVPKTDNFISALHFASTGGRVWTLSGMSVCLSGPGCLSGAFRSLPPHPVSYTHLTLPTIYSV